MKVPTFIPPKLFFAVSIPEGAIEGSQKPRRPSPRFLVSIPEGAIEGHDLRVAVGQGVGFQYPKVRLKVFVVD